MKATTPIVVFLLFIVVTSTDALCGTKPRIVNLTSSALPYELGREIGEKCKSEIERRLSYSDEDATYARRLVAKSDSLKALVTSWKAIHKESFPDAVSELSGISAGSGVSMDDLFVQQTYVELLLYHYHKLSSSSSSSSITDGHCTDVMMFAKEGKKLVHGHNDDWTCELAPDMVILQTASWTAYTHPASLVGGAFVVNRWGLSFGVNTAYPLDSGGGTFSSAFILRSLIDSKNIGEVLARLPKYPVRGGFVLDVSSACERRAASIEVYGATFSVRSISWKSRGASLVHTNTYDSLNVDRWESAYAKRHRDCAKTATFLNVTDVRRFLGDSTDCPVFETDIDKSETMATLIADADLKTLTVYTNPNIIDDDRPLVLPWNFVCDTLSKTNKNAG